MSHRLPNYVRTYRKRTGLSQTEVAFLLGCHRGSKVSRYECYARTPTLQTALAYAAVFQAPLRELFGGIYEETLTAVQARARALIETLAPDQSNRATGRKLQLLQNIFNSTLDSA